jgi:ubiquinone/menaquinone biosynthesis C-methylase UbiE
MEKKSETWEEVSSWYDVLVGEKGHYYHREVILPNLLRLMNIKGKQLLLDLACGQGVLARNLPKEVDYWGVDIAPSLIESAQQYKRTNCHFLVGDITQRLDVKDNFFDIACCVLALQGIQEGNKVLQNASLHLKTKGKLFLVLNHPAFRIPRQSMWGIDDKQKLQYRRLNLYLSEQNIPIKVNPKKEEEVWSFHHPLSTYSKWLLEAGFVIELMEEWVSNKKSTGSNARMENRARAEFPLFLTIVARKETKNG